MTGLSSTCKALPLFILLHFWNDEVLVGPLTSKPERTLSSGDTSPWLLHIREAEEGSKGGSGGSSKYGGRRE